MASMQIISVLASLLLLSSAAPENRRSVPPEPVSEYPAFSTTEEPRDYSTPYYPSNTPDSGYRTPEYDYSGPDYSNDVVVSCDASLNEAFTFLADERSYVFTAGGNFTDGIYTQGYYSNNQRCTLTFVTTESRIFEIRVDRLQLEYSGTCNYDSLCYGKTKVCSTWPENGDYSYYYQVPAGQTFTIDFRTDSSVVNAGFALKARSYLSNLTSDYYTPTAQYATSPYDFSYIYTNPEYYVDICAQDNDDQTRYGTDNDFIYYSTENYLYTFSEPQDSGPTIVSCDNGNTYHSYYLYGSSSNYNSYYNSQEFSFRSSNYGSGFYNDNERCTLVFYTWDTPKLIQVYFNDFEVENVTDCMYDKVCIRGVKYCGNWTTGNYQYYAVPAYSSFTIYSLTDSSVTKRGFDITLTTSDTTTTYPSYEAVSGDGSSPYSVNYDYVDASNYVDRCSDSYDTTSYPSDQPPTPYYDTSAPIYDPRPGDSGVSDAAAFSLRQIERTLESTEERIHFAIELARGLLY